MTPISTKFASQKIPGLEESEGPLITAERPKLSISKSTPSEILETLRTKPNRKELSQILDFLTLSEPDGPLPIHDSSPVTAKIINVLVNNSIPDFWQDLRRSKKDTRKILQCLTSVTGLGAILARFRGLLLNSEDGKPAAPSSHVTLLKELLDVLSLILEDSNFLPTMFASLPDPSLAPAKYAAVLSETVSLICSSKLLSTASEAVSVLQKRSSTVSHEYWTASGQQYAHWLGSQISSYTLEIDETEKLFGALAQMLGKSLSLGYRGIKSENFRESTKSR